MCLLLGVSVQNNYKNNNSNKSNNNSNNNEVAEGARETKSSVKTKFWLKFSPCFGSQLEPRASCMPRPFSLMPKPASDPPAASSWEILFSSPHRCFLRLSGSFSPFKSWNCFTDRQERANSGGFCLGCNVDLAEQKPHQPWEDWEAVLC